MCCLHVFVNVSIQYLGLVLSIFPYDLVLGRFNDIEADIR